MRSEAAAVLKIESIHWKSSQLLTEAYIHNYSQVDALFEYNPADADNWEKRSAWLDNERRLSVDRGELAEALLEFNREIGGSQAALQAVAQLKDERTLCVVGGQQAGLFTGQALVIYKAVSLIRAARSASAKLGRPVVPVFWIAGEDHDFDEVNHMYYLSQEAQINKIKLDHPTGVRSSVAQLPIAPEQWAEALAQLDASLIPTEFKSGWMDTLRAIAEESRSLVDFFARMMAKLFASSGLVLMNSDDPKLRKLESAMFLKLIEEQEGIQSAVRAGKEQVEALGFSPQVELQERNANLFVIDGEERILLYADEASDGFTDRKRERSYSREQLLDWAATAPERLSNNVMTRPLMQDYLFPVLGTVLGPGEVAYWALTRGVFKQLGMQMPVVLPRMEFTLLEGIVQKNMVKYGLSLDDIIYRLEEKQQEWLRGQDALKLEERFGEVKGRFKDMYQPLVELISGINPGLGKLGDTNLSKIIEQIDFLEHKAADAVRTQFDASLRQFQRIGLSVLPLGKPQERVYNILAYLNKYGTGWLDELADSELECDGWHKVIYL